MVIKVIRQTLGYTILFLNAVFRPRRQRRSTLDQQRVDQETTQLSLYQFHLCPFCVRVRRMMYRLNLNIEVRDAKNNDTHRQDLLSGGGRIKVPCLRIEETGDKKGEVTWLYESLAINAYLENRFSTTPITS